MVNITGKSSAKTRNTESQCGKERFFVRVEKLYSASEQVVIYHLLLLPLLNVALNQLQATKYVCANVFMHHIN